jgi:hypothetical protein
MDESGFIPLIVSLDQVITQTDLVVQRLKEEEANLRLLNLQNQFVNNAEIFKPQRRLILEGPLERVKVINDVADCKAYYFHLFSDRLIYSSKKSSSVNISYKLQKSIDLSGLQLFSLSPEEYNVDNIISLTSKSDNFSISL